MDSGQARESSVTGHKGSRKSFGEREICSVIGGRVVPQFPNPAGERKMTVALNPEICKIGQGLSCTLIGQLP